MKQSTKFIWIYGLILFSFALILIFFAGLTQKETETVSQSLTSLTQERNSLKAEREQLKAEVANLVARVDELTLQNGSLYAEKEAAILAYGGEAEVTRTLLKAYSEKKSGNAQMAKKTVEGLDVSTMTDAQKYIYNIIIGE